MKTRLLIIIIVTVVSISLFVGMWIAQNERNIQDQKFMEKWRHERELLLDEIAQEKRDKENNKINSTWRADEDYCQEWCDNDELYKMGCEQPILAHLTKQSNLLDEEFHGKYAIEDEGLPNGVTKENFQECVDFILEKRTTVELENENVKSKRKILECYGIFNCNVSSQYFESCIGAKKNGVTIEQLCLDSDITIDDGGATM